MTPLSGGTQALRLKPLEAEAKARVSGLSPTFGYSHPEWSRVHFDPYRVSECKLLHFEQQFSFVSRT